MNAKPKPMTDEERTREAFRRLVRIVQSWPPVAQDAQGEKQQAGQSQAK